MKKAKRILIAMFLAAFLGTALSGCGGDRSGGDGSVDFSESAFRTTVLKNLKDDAKLQVEGSYLDGYMNAEYFHLLEEGSYQNGTLNLAGKAYDPRDFGDPSLPDGRTYGAKATAGGGTDLALGNGTVLAGYYDRYFEILKQDPDAFTVTPGSDARVTLSLEKKSSSTALRTGRTVYVYEYARYEIRASKTDGKILSAKIHTVRGESYLQAEALIGQLFAAGPDQLFRTAGEINEALGTDFEGIYKVQSFSADFR